MNGSVQEWIDKAAADFNVAGRELRVDQDPSYDAVCFHAQQCVEKLLKAVLVQSEARVPKIHDLVRLSRLVQDVDSTWSWPEEDSMNYRWRQSSPAIPARRLILKTPSKCLTFARDYVIDCSRFCNHEMKQ